ncbi:MAG: hypothetical protein M3O70_17480 [Actinomycetota bacterium]|nr:hypothetical protein [Actinomycetota bacterium]
MSRRPNRIVLLLAGLLVASTGTVALLSAADILPVAEPGALYDRLTTSALAHPEQWTASVVLGGLLVAAVGTWLVQRQLKIRRGGRLGRVTLTREQRGRTTLEATAVARAAAADLRGRRGVVNSDVRMVTFGSRPRLLVSLAIDTDTEPRKVLGRAEEVYQRLCRLLGKQDLHVETIVRPTGKPPRRVQ